MEEKKIKKKKQTLTVSIKKPIDISRYTQDKGKTSVVIDKQISKKRNERRFYNRENNAGKLNLRFEGKTKTQKVDDITSKNIFTNRSSEIRKKAEERATKRFKNLKEENTFSKKENIGRNKSLTSKREYKLTLSKALIDDATEGKERSLASVRRARLKEKKSQVSNDKKIETKKIVREVNIPDKITIQELSNRMAIQASSIIKHLLSMGVTATINHSLDADTAEYIVKEMGNIPIRERKPDLNIHKSTGKESKNLKPKSPVVTVMGHVDHGKTSLLDALRKTNVVAREHGGITQHIGAYKIKTEEGKHITFIDTPGHAAFTEMRARGSRATDIVVLVVAADDGVKPQTIEAIKHSKAAKAPIVVAINKCDLPNSDPQKIKNQLLEYELIAEELSGDTLYTEVSATTKKNLDKLKENIILQADLLGLKADFDANAIGVVLESRIDSGKGPVSTVLVTNGSLRKGDFFVSGVTWGKIRAMIDDQGQNIELAIPSTPVEILGTNNAAGITISGSNQNVGIGTTSPGYNLEVAGTFYSAGSSIDYKKHVTDLDVDSSLIHSLRPVSYNYKKEYKDFGYNVKEGKQIGLVSEEVAETIPELAIMKDGRPKNVDYQKLAVVLLAEVQSLKKDIEELKKDN